MTDPRWIEPLTTNIEGQDFLGLRLVQERIVAHLLPGIITITPRARYYGFYAWLLTEYADAHPSGWSFKCFLQRREQIFGLANRLHGAGVRGLAGSQAFDAHLHAHADATDIPLTAVKYLKASMRGYANYAGVMRNLGLVVDLDDERGWEVSLKGQALAEAYGHAIAHTAYYARRREYDEAESIEMAVLAEYGAACSLDNLAGQPDHLSTLDVLLALDAYLEPDPRSSNASPLGNMRATLGLMLDMQAQTDARLTDALFRRHCLYGPCVDYTDYKPTAVFLPVLTQWQMFQIRDLYTFGLYALWTAFLHYLKGVDGATLPDFYAYLVESVDVTAVAHDIDLPLPEGVTPDQTLAEHLNALLDAAGIPPGDWQERCRLFAQQSQSPLQAQTLFGKLRGMPNATYIGRVWLMLMALACRLEGVPHDSAAWYWAVEGNTRYRALADFVEDINRLLAAGATVMDAWQWLIERYVVYQHTVASLEKWRSRKANTFHFQHEDGWFTFLRNGSTDLSATRFGNAYGMLGDLDLYWANPESGDVELTGLGRATLQHIQESYNAQ